ncbi:MAG: hypothetical protein PHO02_02610 [Candidatus Nanoarchaeia archaeon]|nr:hypothetical protein [Candidatus Nanoarchaeia archaeon]
MKKTALILAFPIILLMLSIAAFAAPFGIAKVTINGMESNSERIALELGANVQVGVTLNTAYDAKDVRVKAWIGGYEYDDVLAVSDVFDMKTGVTYRKELTLELPRDLSVIEDHDYTLHVEVRGRDNSVESTSVVYLEPPRHSVVVQDVIIRPSTMVDAGKTLAVQVRLENFGEKTEKDIKVEAYLPQFGVSGIEYVDVLDPFEGEDSTESTSFIMLTVPSDMITGDYQLKIKASYARGHEETEATRMIYVKGKDSSEEYASELAKESVTAISRQQDFVVGAVGSYRVAIANIGDSKKVYTVEVSPLSWGKAEVFPASLELASGDASEIRVSILPEKEGMQQVTIKVKEGNTVIKQDTYGVTVSASAVEKQGSVDKLNSAFKDVDKGRILMLLSGVLVIALIVAVIAGTRPRY